MCLCHAGALQGGPETYRRATDEALALLRWIRQLAAASGAN
ncbi:MAG: type III-B CRISPR module-associated protein Cmr5 [Candidatus Binatia bacterium]